MVDSEIAPPAADGAPLKAPAVVIGDDYTAECRILRLLPSHDDIAMANVRSRRPADAPAGLVTLAPMPSVPQRPMRRNTFVVPHARRHKLLILPSWREWSMQRSYQSDDFVRFVCRILHNIEAEKALRKPATDGGTSPEHTDGHIARR